MSTDADHPPADTIRSLTGRVVRLEAEVVALREQMRSRPGNTRELRQEEPPGGAEPGVGNGHAVTSAVAAGTRDDDADFLSPDEAERLFDEHVQARLGMSGEELARRWDAGEYQDLDETSLHGEIIGLMMLRPRGRAKPE